MPFYVRKAPPILTPATYPAIVTKVEVIEGKYGPRVLWSVDLSAHQSTYPAVGYTDTTFFEGSPEYRWACAILQQDLQPNESFDESELIGAAVQARISVKPGQAGKVFYTVEEITVPLPGELTPAVAPTDTEDDTPF